MLLSQMRIKLSGLSNGSGRSMTVLTTLKIAALAPTPSASVMAATSVNLGLFLSARRTARPAAMT